MARLVTQLKGFNINWSYFGWETRLDRFLYSFYTYGKQLSAK
ncbi:unnamed protein product [marine sediment metagenome]|uniref:Uncharacterized protein n=1 Tax=marine sediment metagenome TaxID=412755 RepID=X1EGD9_9ZZZZ